MVPVVERPGFPFSQGTPFVNGQAYLGGYVYLLAGPLTAGTAYTITHALRRPPRFARALDAGTSYTPKLARGATWSASQIQIVPDTAVASGQTLTVFVA